MRLMKYFILSALVIAIAVTSIYAQEKTYEVHTLKSEPPKIDGHFTDNAWRMIEWSDDFTQREPYEGRNPSQETVFKILHDDNFLYVAIRAYDSDPDSIVKRLSRRDNQEGDNVGIHIDSYNDNRTAFVFNVSAAGVKSDWVTSDDGSNNDRNWDPIWYVKTNIDSLGWTAEMKIPFTQLRFSQKGEQEWGLQIRRNIFRYDEEVHWDLIPKDAGGWVSEFGKMTGMSAIEPQKEKSITPYTVAKMERFKKVPENPFRSNGKNNNINAGLNGKFGVTNNLTLDLTINPDFGQVEADPSEVNLSAYETYFEEKRPFFIEGSSIMSFRLMQFGDFMSDNLFYSRRIGKSPSYYPSTESDEYVNRPDNTTILGAAKLTGKTKNGWSVGILESMTDREQAKVSNGTNSHYKTVEPLSNYFLGRVQKDFNGGSTLLGGIFTATNRKIEAEHLDFMHDEAYTGGINFQHQWKDRTYLFAFRGIFSHVRGTEEAIIRTQRSSARYYQRPDVNHLNVDSSLHSLSGHGGSLLLGKMGKGNWRYALFLNWKSPGLEINDIGYQRDADELSQLGWIQYRFLEPFSIFRSMYINVNQWQIWDYTGTNQVRGGNIQMNMNLKNYWGLGYGVSVNSSSLSKTALRGGPYLKTPASLNYWWYANTDYRKDLKASFGNNQGWSSNGHSYYLNFWANISYRPFSMLDISINPVLSFRENNLQYVKTEEYNKQERYIMASIDRTTLSMALRLNFSITPNLSIQYWGQPFIATGHYDNFKHITNSTATNYEDRFQNYQENQITYVSDDEVYEIDENTDGITDYSIDNPNFKVFQFKSNLVARWEYTPGSTIYLVWSQNRDQYITDGPFQFRKDFSDLYSIFPHNVFLVKLTYRLGL